MNHLRLAHGFAFAALGGVTLLGLLGALRAPQAQPEQYLYVAAGDAGLRVVDVLDSAAPVEIGALDDLTGSQSVVVQEEYAYVARGDQGLAIVDVADPTDPTLVGSLAITASDLAVFGEQVFVVSPTVFRVVDVSDPVAPAELGSLRMGATAVAVDGYHAYLAGALGAVVVSVADPAQPEQVGLFLGRPEDLAVGRQQLVQVGELPLRGLYVIDVRTPGNPSSLGGIQLSGRSRSLALHPQTLAYVAATAASDTDPGGLTVVDFDDPVMPYPVAGYAGDFVDVALSGDLAFLVRADGALEVLDISDPRDPQPVGALVSSWQARRIAVAEPVPLLPTPTDTALATATASPTPTAGTVTATATATVPSLTETATATFSPTASPTLQPSLTPPAVTPSVTPTALPTRPPGRTWRQFTTANAPLEANNVRRVTTDAEGTAWARIYRGPHRADAVVAAQARGTWRAYADLRQAVTRQADRVRRLGVLAGFWAFNERGDIWIGAEHFDGLRWRVEGSDEWTPDGRLRLQQEVIVDRTGIARVPFETQLSCRGTAPCRLAGLRPYVFGRHLQGDIMVDADPTAWRRGIPALRLLANPAPAGTLAGGWAVAHRALYPVPQPNGVPYPVILDIAMSPRHRTSGHATAACLRPDGRPVVFTWVERHGLDAASRRIISYHVYENQFAGETWATVIDFSISPLFPAGVRDDWVAAAAYGPGGERWLASAGGWLAVQNSAGLWSDAFAPREIGLPEGASINDLAVGVDGTVWLATTAGLFAYGVTEPARSEWQLHLPIARRD